MAETKRLEGYIEKWHVKKTNWSGKQGLEVFGVSNVNGITTTSHVKSKDLSSYLVIEPNTFAYNPYRINVGSIARNEENKPVIVSPMYVVFSPKQSISPAYLECFFKSSFFSKQMKSRLEGSVRQCLTFDGLSSIPIKKFSTNEQQNFINLVCKLKNVEQIESQILEKFKEGKNYLLNSLFI